MIPWFSKTEGNTYATIASSPFPLQGKPTQAQDVAATPTDLKQIQKLTGCVAALSRFISRLGEKALPLYCLLRRTEHFEWTNAATAGLEEIKALLASNPILAAPNIGEPMLLYIAATHQVVSAVLVVERETDGHKFPLQKRYTTNPLSSLHASHGSHIIKR